jgi:TonB-dependent receptor
LFASTALSGAAARAQDASSVDELVVVGQRLSQQRSIDLKRDASGISDTISADEIGRLPDKNAAENLERLPGVSLKYDQGEGRYVSIRGVDGALNNVTINGVQVGSPEPDTRNLPLDVLGGQLTSRIEVVKAVTPDLDGQGIGGTVNLVTQSPFDFKKPLFAQGSAQYGSQELNDRHPFQGDATFGALLGPDQKLGFIAGVNYSDRKYRTFGTYPDDWRPVAGVTRGMPTNIKYTTYELDRQRLGVNGAVEYRPTDQDKLYVRAFYSSLKEHEYRQRYRLDFATDALVAARMTINPDGRTGFSTTGQRRQDLRLEQKDKTVFSSMFGGEHTRDAWTADYSLNYGKNQIDDHDQNWQFRSGSTITTDFDMGPLLYTAKARVEARPSDMAFNQYSNSQTDGDERIWSGALNAKRALTFGRNSYVKFGFKYRDAEKVSDVEDPIYGLASGAANRFTLADFNLLGTPTYSHLGSGVTYPNLPTISLDTPATVSGLIGSRVTPNTASTLANGVTSDFDIKEKVAAGYAMANLNFGQLTVLGGVRVEDTRTDASGFRLTNGTTVTPVRQDNAYTHILPGLHLRYEPTQTVVLRAAFTNTVGRPEYSQLYPGSTFSFTDLGNGHNDGGISVGNADLKPYVSYNFDGSAEWYFAKGGLLSMGAFYKAIDNPIYGYSQTQQNITYLNLFFDHFAYSQPRNADKGHISGIELNYQQQFRFLPGPLAGFGVAANLTLTDSSLTLPNRTDEVKFPRQSKSIYGAQLFYQKYGVQGTVSYHWASSYQDTIGDSAETDTFFNSYARVDAKISYAITPRLDIFVEGQNLNDEVLWEYQGGRKDWQIGYERYGRTFYLGVSARW